MKHRKGWVLAAVVTALGGCAALEQLVSVPPPANVSDAVAPRPAPAAAAPAALPAPEKITSIEGITEYRLANGLRVLLFPDSSKDTLTISVTYFVGSRHEGYGESGMAHLLEHMLFKGTKTRGTLMGEFEKRGGSFNGTTWYDRTNYFETLPATEANLEFAIDVEADRMVNSRIDAADLAKEFSVVRNEFELGENSPDGVLSERMLSTAYLWHNYGKSTIGSRSDIERVPADSLRAFYQRYYQPDNAMVVLAGRFDEKIALGRIQNQFGAIPKPTRVLAPTYTVEPVQDGERSVVLRRNGDVKLVGLVYHGVPGAHEDYIPLDAALNLLTDDPSGRLYQSLVKAGIATSVSSAAYGLAEPGPLLFLAEVDAKKPVENVRDKMIQVVENFGPPAPADLARYVNRQRKNLELAFAQSDQLAIYLSEFAAMGDWRLFFLTRDRLDTLTPEQVSAAAKRYLRGSNRTVGLFLPEDKSERAPLPEQPDVAALVGSYQGKAALAEGEVFDASIQNIERRTERFSLPSGMKVALLQKKTRGDAVEATLQIHYGSEAELKGKIGAAGMLPSMLERGTRKLQYQQIRDKLDELRAEVGLSPGSDPGSADVSISTVGSKLPAVLDLVADMLIEPTFPQAELDVLRREYVSSLEGQLQDPSAQAMVAMSRAVAPYRPEDVRYRPTTTESIARAKAVTPADLKELHKLWGGSYAQLAIVGGFDPAAVKKVLEARFANWKSPRPFRRVDQIFHNAAPQTKTIDTPDKEMAFVVTAQPVRMRDDAPDYPALELASYILGGAADSRLVERLRQKEGWSYGTYARLQVDPFDESSVLFTAALAAPQNARKAENGMLEEIQRLRSETVSAEELAAAKKSYVEHTRRFLTNDSSVAGELADGLYAGRTLSYEEALLKKIEAVSAADLSRALQTYVDTGKLSRIVAGDGKKMSEE